MKLKPSNIPDIFKNCDVIIEAFDLASEKQMLIETVQTEMPDVPIIVGSGMAGWGDNNSIQSRQVGNIYICGDEKSEIAEELTTPCTKSWDRSPYASQYSFGYFT